MTPNELYAMEPEKISTNLNDLGGGYFSDHFSEISELDCCFWFDETVEQDKILIHIYKDHCFDGRRVWDLRGVFFEARPVMITQNAGREGSDHSATFITDEALFLKMKAFIQSMILEQQGSGICCLFDADVDIPNLTNFYGYSLDKFIG